MARYREISRAEMNSEQHRVHDLIARAGAAGSADRSSY